MSEALLSPAAILLFGRTVSDLQITPSFAGSAAPGHLEQQLRAPDANFARIYGFGHEGCYYMLPGMALFLVHGPGESAEAAIGGLRLAQSGAEAAVAESLGLPKDLMVWRCDRADLSVRMDVRLGLFDQLLLESASCLPAVQGMSVAGMSAHGMSIAGMSAQGMSVGGMSAAGMSVAGMSAQGMSVAGMSAKRESSD